MKKTLKTSAWAGVIGLVLGIISLFITFAIGQSTAGIFISGLISLIGGVAGILFNYGFVFLGKKFDVKLLQVMAWIGIAFGILAMIVGFGMSFVQMAGIAGAQEMYPEDVGPLAGMALVAILILWVLISAVAGAYSILYGIGILKLKDKVEHANTAGILNIIAGATYIIVVGFVVVFIARIFELLLMFKAAEKFEKK